MVGGSCTFVPNIQFRERTKKVLQWGRTTHSTDGEVIRGQACDALDGLRDPCDFNPLRWVFVMPADQAFAVQRITSHALKVRGMDSLEAKV